MDDGDPLSVRVEHAGRRFIVRLADHRWWRSTPGEPRAAIPVARQGSEDLLARQLVTALLGKL